MNQLVNKTFLLLIAFVAVRFMAEQVTYDYDPFTDITICVPLNIVIRPSVNEYRVVVDADDVVIDALDIESESGILTIETSTPFMSQNAIKIFVELPADKLSSVSLRGKADVTIDGEFNSTSLGIQNLDDGTIHVPATKVFDTLAISNLKGGVIVYRGFAFNVELTVEQSAKTYLMQVEGDISYTGSGRTVVYVKPTREDVAITGTAASLAQINIAQRDCMDLCDVTYRFRSPCKCVSHIALPPQAVKLNFSCGIDVQGESMCLGVQADAQLEAATSASFIRSFASSGSATTNTVAKKLDCMVETVELAMIE